MKTNGTRVLIIAIFVYLFVLILSFSTQAQPEYNFTTVSHISGTDKQIGAIYRATNVRPGIDAIVTVANITGGVELKEIDGNSGFKEALQPVIDIPASSSGYVELLISFVTTGTFAPRVMLEVPITCIDVDGKMQAGRPVNEFDMVRRTPGIYTDFSMTGGELQITFSPTWITGTNTSGIDYPGVDTLAKEAMFSTISSNVTSVTVRVGANNQTTAKQNRLRSIYFKRFTYVNSFLSKSCLLSFRGTEKNKKVELQWELLSDCKLRSVTIEKSVTGGNFKSIGFVQMSEEGANTQFKFDDKETIAGNTLYRLKMEGANGTISYSNMLSFRDNSQLNNSFKIYPSAIQSNATVSVKADNSGTGMFELVDLSGRIVHRQTLSVQEGANNIQLNSINTVTSGTYVAVLKIENNIFTQKVIKQ